MTPQRMAILHVLRHAGTHLTPGDVYKLARKEFPRLTEPTVYRTLEFLAENGLVHPSQTGNGHFSYQIAGDDHHHLICRICKSEVEVQHQVLETLYRALESTSGYMRIDSHMTFFGVCPKCQQ
jgi:Fur family ferric uptake transcriptional regulator